MKGGFNRLMEKNIMIRSEELRVLKLDVKHIDENKDNISKLEKKIKHSNKTLKWSIKKDMEKDNNDDKQKIDEIIKKKRRRWTVAERIAISNRQKGKKNAGKGFTGHKHTEETKKKILISGQIQFFMKALGWDSKNPYDFHNS